jgi:hypothetical protein
VIAVFPAGGTLAAVLVVWLGTTASVGRHARPGRLARIAARAWARQMGRPVPYPEDEQEDLADDDQPVSPEQWRVGFDAAWERYAAADAAVSPEQWAAAMLRARMPHLFSPTWLDDQIADYTLWAARIWTQIRATKREAGISE